MKGFGKKLLAVLLAAVMVFGAAPLGGLAAIDIDLDLGSVFESKAFAAEEFTSGSFTYSLNEDGEAQITGGNITGKLEIPSVIDGHTVVSVGFAAFRYQDVTEVIFPDTVTEIGGEAFYYCDLLESVTFGKGLKKINRNAFERCGITEIEIPDSVELIDYEAFYYCTDLADVNIGKNVTVIGTRAFSETAITEIKIPDSVKTVGYGAFQYCDLLASVDIGSSVERIEGYAFSCCYALKSVEIPGSVTYIGSGAFRKCTVLESVKICDSVTVIESGAFGFCTALESVDLGSAVKEIYAEAFYGCTALKSIKLPDSVKSIGYGAFGSCTALESVDLGNGITSVGNNAFASCSALRSIDIPDSVKKIGSFAFCYCESLESVDLGNGVDEIREDAFSSCTALKSVTIPAGIEYIGSNVFSGCTALEKATFADGATFVGEAMFSGCASLTEVNIPASVKKIDSTAFDGCTSLESLNIAAESPFFVSDGEVVYNKNKTELVLLLDKEVTSFEIPATVKRIGDRAFYCCGKLESVTIPEGVTYIGTSAFYYCPALTEVKLPSTLKTIGVNAFYYCNNLKSVTIPAGVTEIGAEAFAVTALESATIPDSVTVLGSSIFYYCPALRQVTLSSNLREVPYGMFESCSALESITLPEGLTIIGEYAFSNCTALKSVVIPDSVKTIGYHAFAGCTSLESVDLGSVEEIGSNVFAGCDALKSIDLPDSLKIIEDNAFYSCLALTEITIPASVERVGNNAFSDCENLAAIEIEGENVDFGGNAFAYTAHWNNDENWGGATNSEGDRIEKMVYYADGYLMSAPYSIKGSYTVEAGTSVIVGNALAYQSELESVILPAGLKRIGASAFYSCSALKSISIPAGVEYVGDEAFGYCSELASATIPDNVTFGYRVFNNCKKLGTITAGKNLKGLSVEDIRETEYYNNEENWADGVLYLGSVFLGAKNALEGTFTLKEGTTAIAENAFKDQKNLTQVIIPDTVSFIGYYAFSNCSALTAIDLPEALTYIGKYAFNGCSSITSVDVPETVTEIGKAAFMLCTSLESAALPDSLTDVAPQLFMGCMSLKEVNIPANAEIIGEMAFALCINLENITLPEKVFYIDSGAFAACVSLDSINLTNVRGIAEMAFMACTSLKEIKIPAGLEMLGQMAFGGTSSVEKYTVDAANTYFTTDSTGALFSKDMTVLYEYPAASPATSYAIPEGVTTTFMPFVSTLNLENLHIPASLGADSSGAELFMISTIFMKVDLNSVVAAIKDYIEPLVSIITSIEDGTVGSKTVEILNTVIEFVLDYANGIESKDELYQEISTFVSGLIDTVDNTALKSFTVAEGNPWLYAEDGVLYADAYGEEYLLSVPASKTGDLKINENVTAIMPAAFAFCDLGEIVIPKGINEIPEMGLALCKADKIVIPKTVEYFGTVPSLSFILSSIGTLEVESMSVFEEMENSEYVFTLAMIDEFVLPSSATVIPDGMFTLSGIKSIKIPEKVKTIGQGAFFGSFCLEEITIPDSVKEIGSGAFAACVQLEKVNVSSNSELEKIGEGAFLGTQVSEFYVPAAVNEIGLLAFKPSVGGAVSLGAEVLKSLMEDYKEDIEKAGIVIDYEKATSALDNAASWFSSGSTVTIDERNKSFVCEDGIVYTADKTTVIHADESLSGVYEIPSTVTAVAEGAFAFTNVTEIIVPDSVTFIGSGAFALCPKLEKASIGAGLTELDNVFGLSYNLERVEILPTVTEITDDAFMLCPNVTIAGYADTAAHKYAYDNEIPFETLDGEAFVSITAPTAVASEKVAVYGHTLADTAVEIYDGETKIAETLSGKTGYWSIVVELANPAEGSTHTLTAKINAGTEDEVCSSPVEVLYSRGVPTLESITLYHAHQARTVTLETKNATSESITYNSGAPYTYEIKLSAYDGTKTLYVVSGKYKMPAVYDARNDVYVASGYFTDDFNYIPGYVTVELDGRTLSGKGFCFPFIIDPSGFVYEGVHSNRIEGASASIFYQDENGLANLWADAPLFGQLSTIITGADGVFKWNVPSGNWQIKVEKEGYESAVTDWLPVPPEQLEVYIGLVAKDSPAVKYVNGYTDGIDVTFSQYMDASTVNSETVIITDAEDNVITGSWRAVDAEKSGDGSKYLAKTFTFVADSELSGEYGIKVLGSGAANYAGKTLASHHTETFSVASRIRTLNVPKTLELEYMKDYSNSKENVITVDGTIAAASKKVNVVLSNSNYVEGISAVTLDENGRAEIAVVPTRPGEVKITFNLDGTALTEETAVTVSMASTSEVTGISLSDSSKNVIVGEDFRIYATVAPDFATDKQVTWVSSDSSVATVDDNGLVTAVSEGTATITAVTVDGGFTADCVITAYIPRHNVIWNVDGETSTVSVKVGDAIAKPADPVKENHIFLGWTPEVPDVMPDNELSFTAVFKKNVYNVNWVVDGETSTVPVKVGDAIAKPADPVKEGYEFTGWSPAIPSAMPENDLTFTAGFERKAIKVEIGAPTVTEIRYNDAIWLHLNTTEGEIPADAKIEWTLSNGNFTATEVSEDSFKCLITAAANGNCVITVTVYDANGEELASDTQEMTSKAGFFHKIIAFFLKLFGLLKIYER